MKTTLAIIITSILATQAIAGEPCTTHAECNDNNECTADVCFMDVCVNFTQVPFGFCCDFVAGELNPNNDGNPCTIDSCDLQGNATHTPISGCTPCQTSTDCDDNNACTNDFCIQNICNTLTTTPYGFCCDPLTGDLALKFDFDPCTADSCAGGMPVHFDLGPDCGNFSGHLAVSPGAGQTNTAFLDGSPVTPPPVVLNAITMPVRVIVDLKNSAIQHLKIGVPCAYSGDEPGVPPLTFVSGSLTAEFQNSLLSTFPGTALIQQGQCAEILCSDPAVDCPGGATKCTDEGFCPFKFPTIEINLVEPQTYTDNEFVAEFFVDVPEDALGIYRFNAVCCPDDANCDDIIDGGCPGGEDAVLTAGNVAMGQVLNMRTLTVRVDPDLCREENLDDMNECTDDRFPNAFNECQSSEITDEFGCCHRLIYNDSFFCCNPTTGETGRINDSNNCTIDFCDENGIPVHDLIFPGCGSDPNRLLVVPSGIDPLNVLSNPDFQHTVDPGTTFAVEVFIDIGDLGAQEFSVQLSCDYFSNDPTAPPLHLIANSVNVNTANPDHVGQFGPGFPAIDRGQCDILPCIFDVHCTGGGHCPSPPNNFCSIVSPRVSYTGLLGPIGANVPVPLYIGEAQYDIPLDARGQYTVRSECCDGTFDAGCALDQTTLDSGNTILDLVTPLIVNIQTGDCLVGNTCTANVTRPECEIDLGGTFRPNGNCGCFNNDECNDNDPCTTDTCVDIGSLCPNGTKPDNNNCCHINETPIQFCCDATTGQLRLRTDANACTQDTCDPTGQPTHEPIPNCGLNEPIPTLTTWGQATLVCLMTFAIAITIRGDKLRHRRNQQGKSR